MKKNQESLQKLTGKELEEYGRKIFEKIGLRCFTDLGQTKLNEVTSGCAEDEHLEFDYLIPNNQVCLIGEITSRDGDQNIRKKYDKFVKQVKTIKDTSISTEIWNKLGIEGENIRLFREIEYIKAFFILTRRDRVNVNLSKVEDIAIFYKSDFLKIVEYSENIGIWTKNYFLNKFDISHNTSDSLTIYENRNCLIKIRNKKISGGQYTFLSDLYTFVTSPYELLDIAHVHRKDELPSFQDNVLDYQRLLDRDKLKAIRNNLLKDPDFMFPSEILVILSEECAYNKDGSNNSYLLIPKRYGSISVIDGQHRLFSYANETVKSIIKNNCQIKITAIHPQTSDQEEISKFSAGVFIEINTNQTRVEISHLDKIAYDLGSEDPKVIATKIIVNINNRKKFRSYFTTKSDNTSGIVESGTIIDAIKKITSLQKIEKLVNSRAGKNKQKQTGYERLFQSKIDDLCNKDILVEKGVVLFERYFSEMFTIFKYDKPTEIITDKKEIKCSFYYSKFWAGFINLLIIFIEEGLDWKEVRNELNKIKDNVMKLREVEQYTDILFYSKDNRIPDASSSPTKTGNFLNKNRQKPTSIQSDLTKTP